MAHTSQADFSWVAESQSWIPFQPNGVLFYPCSKWRKFRRLGICSTPSSSLKQFSSTILNSYDASVNSTSHHRKHFYPYHITVTYSSLHLRFSSSHSKPNSQYLFLQLCKRYRPRQYLFNHAKYVHSTHTLWVDRHNKHITGERSLPRAMASKAQTINTLWHQTYRSTPWAL